MRINPPTLFGILIAAIVAVDRFLPLIEITELWLPWCGAVLAISGVGVSATAKRHFERIGTNVYTFEEPGELVTTGLFGISRNPMYLGLVVAAFGAALISATLAALVLSAAFTLIVRIYMRYNGFVVLSCPSQHERLPTHTPPAPALGTDHPLPFQLADPTSRHQQDGRGDEMDRVVRPLQETLAGLLR